MGRGSALFTPPLWLKIVVDASHRTYYLGFNNHDWIQLYQEAAGSYMTEDQVGFYADSGGSGYPNCATLVSWNGV